MAGSRAYPARVRIVGGRWRRRFLEVADVPALRPTPDRVRETLFNWLGTTIAGAECLDLFAGTGVLGLEALSRGAGRVVLIEHDGRVADVLRANAARLEAAPEIVQADALSYLKAPPGRAYDIVFLDPPFRAGLLAAAIRLLDRGGWIKPGGLIYIEGPKAEAAPALPAGWQWLRSKTAGQVAFGLAQRRVDE